MKAIISTTYDSKYLFFLPITTWCWNKLGVGVICFMPDKDYQPDTKEFLKGLFAMNAIADNWECDFSLAPFKAPEHKEATYAQCSRLYAAALDFPEDEVLITSDVDMTVFEGMRQYLSNDVAFADNSGIDTKDMLTIIGADLVPPGQYPMCFAKSSVKGWRKHMNIAGKSYQECLDDLLQHIECESFRGNYWGKDQETLHNLPDKYDIFKYLRAKPGTQFATNRYDRDDQFILDRLSPDMIDFHMNRPGFDDNNFNTILTIMKYHYPEEDFQWLCDYKTQYAALL